MNISSLVLLYNLLEMCGTKLDTKEIITSLCDAFETCKYFYEVASSINNIVNSELKKCISERDKFNYRNNDRYRLFNTLIFSNFSTSILLFHSILVGYYDNRTKTEVEISIKKLKELQGIVHIKEYEALLSKFKSSVFSEFRNKLFAHNDAGSYQDKIPSTHLRVMIKIDDSYIEEFKWYIEEVESLLHKEFGSAYKRFGVFPKNYIFELLSNNPTLG